MNVEVRPATIQDRDGIRAVYLQAFPESEARLVAGLAGKLLGADGPAAFSLVAEMAGQVVGHVAFSPLVARGQDGWRGCILAPLAVAPQQHRSGIGSQLVRHGIERLAATAVHMLFVYGDPAYYGRFGFAAEAAARFLPPYELKYAFGWQALVLRDADVAPPRFRLSCVPALRDPALW